MRVSKVETVCHDSLALINCKQQTDESLTSFIYRWSELFLQSCGTTADQCKDKVKIDPFSSQIPSEKTARQVIRKHSKTVAYTFRILKEEKKNYQY